MNESVRVASRPPYRIERPFVREEQLLCERLDSDLQRILTWQFPVLGRGCHEEGIKIRLVSADELRRETGEPSPDIENGPGGFDLLGVYVAGPARAGTCANDATILVSPSLIMDAARNLLELEPLSMSLDGLQRILLAGVVIDELAHALMDGQTGPLQAVTENWSAQYEQSYGHVIEESLAEAFVLVQNFSAPERDLIKRFIARGLPAYRAGFRWLGNPDTRPDDLMETMRAWRDHKALDTAMFARIPGLHNCMHAFQSLASELKRDNGRPQVPFDFRAAFKRDLQRMARTATDTPDQWSADYHLRYRYGAGSGLSAPAANYSGQPCAAADQTVDPDGVAAWLQAAGVTQFRFEGNTVHVDGDVDISGQQLGRFPVRFGRVNGHFNCSGNRLTSLCELPDTTVGNVYCCNNPLDSLAGLDSSRTIAGYLCLDVDQPVADAHGAVQVEGLQLLVTFNAGLTIVNAYLRRPDDIFDCQAELIEKGHERLATLGTCCDCDPGSGHLATPVS